jgi:hypothetical protein
LAVTVSSFVIRYSEFSEAGSALLEAALTGVEAVVGSDAFDTEAQRDEFVMLSLAHALALSPVGRDAGMTMKDGRTTKYSARLAQLRDGNACLHPNRWGTQPDA